MLGVVCDTMIALARLVYDRQAGTGVRKDYFVTSNCVVNMISEEHYRRFVMPYDRKLAGAFSLFGVHNCGWNVDAYAAAYAELGALEYLDFGIRSDLRRLRALFPAATLTPILNPEDVIGRSREEVRVRAAPPARQPGGLPDHPGLPGQPDPGRRRERLLPRGRRALGAGPRRSWSPKAHCG